jgi:hypothetical protein
MLQRHKQAYVHAHRRATDTHGQVEGGTLVCQAKPRKASWTGIPSLFCTIVTLLYTGTTCVTYPALHSDVCIERGGVACHKGLIPTPTALKPLPCVLQEVMTHSASDGHRSPSPRAPSPLLPYTSATNGHGFTPTMSEQSPSATHALFWSPGMSASSTTRHVAMTPSIPDLSDPRSVLRSAPPQSPAYFLAAGTKTPSGPGIVAAASHGMTNPPPPKLDFGYGLDDCFGELTVDGSSTAWGTHVAPPANGALCPHVAIMWDLGPLFARVHQPTAHPHTCVQARKCAQGRTHIDMQTQLVTGLRNNSSQ